MAAATDWLLFGATGAVGGCALQRLRATGQSVLAVSRAPPAAAVADTTLRWSCLDLFDRHAPALHAARVLSAGPLDGFAAWAVRTDLPRHTRVVALSSMSAQVKSGSANAGERALAQRLRTAEQTLAERARERGWNLTLLRPTLIYGTGHDASLTPLLRIARRYGVLLLPRAATGLRQPVHADDVAQALLACAARTDLEGAVLPLPGGEALSFLDMLRRAVQTLPRPPQLWLVPDPPARWCESLLCALPGRGGLLGSRLRRSRVDLVATGAAWDVLGIQPRGFEPPRVS